MKHGSKRLMAGLLAAGMVLAGQAWAMDSEEVIKYRKNVMKSLGGHMGASAGIVRGKVAFNDQLKMHAQATLLFGVDFHNFDLSFKIFGMNLLP